MRSRASAIGSGVCRVALVVGMIMTTLSYGALAGVLSGSTNGTFASPLLAGNYIQTDGTLAYQDNTGTAVYTGMGTSDITWGSHTTSVPGYSSLKFMGNPSFSVVDDQVFYLGTLEYFNGTSLASTAIFGAGLTITATVGGVTINPAEVSINFLATANANVDPVADADILLFDVLPFSFHVYENGTASADIFGKIVGDPYLEVTGIGNVSGPGFLRSVPEPATLALLGLGLVGLGFSRRRKA